MSQSLDLKEIERRVQHSTYQDGLLELFLGGTLLVLGALYAIKPMLVAIFSALWVLFGFRLFERAKQRYIYPRIGYVKLRPGKEADPKGIVVVIAVILVVLLGALGVLLLAMGMDRGFAFWFDYLLPAVIGFTFAIGPFWLAQTYGLKRGYVFAALFLLGGIAFPVLGIAAGFSAVSLGCLLVGLLSLFSGAIMFTRFLRKYPVPAEEASGVIE